MKAFIDTCIKANKELKNYLTSKLSKADLSNDGSVGFGGDKYLKIDKIAENLFIKHLSSFGNIYSEECGFLDNGFKDINIVLDPIDGSDNFFTGIDYFCTSIAYVKNDKTIASIIYNLSTNEYYASYDNKLIYPKLLIDNVKLGIFERFYEDFDLAKSLVEKKYKFRSLGSVALSLANARNCSFVLFCGEFREFDLKAGLHMNKDLNIYKKDKFLLVCKNIKIFNNIKDIINIHLGINPINKY